MVDVKSKDGASASLSTLVTPVCFRTADGEFHGFEGANDHAGCCHGSCAHVWNYETATAHIFPSFARSLRGSAFGYQLDNAGGIRFRERLPHHGDSFGWAAADGQMGQIRMDSPTGTGGAEPVWRRARLQTAPQHRRYSHEIPELHIDPALSADDGDDCEDEENSRSGPAAINDIALVRDGCTVIGCQEKDQPGDVLRRQASVQCLRRQNLRHVLRGEP